MYLENRALRKFYQKYSPCYTYKKLITQGLLRKTDRNLHDFCNNELKKKLAKCGIRLELLEGSQRFMVHLF